jgi:hypothetical protein
MLEYTQQNRLAVLQELCLIIDKITQNNVITNKKLVTNNAMSF